VTIRLGVHLLASQRGYRTVAASPELTPRELAALEPLVFGQTSDAGFLASLDHDPAVFLRMLPGEAGPGRFAITRLFAGHPDEAGRATLELRTLLMARGDYERLVRSSLDRILAHEDLWSRSHFDSGRALSLPEPPVRSRPPVGRNELLMMDAWVRTLDRPGSTAVLADGPEARRLVLSFLRVLSSEDLGKCRWGLRLLSLAVETHVATAPPSLDRGSRELIPIDLRARPANEGIAYLLEQQGVMETLPSSASLVGPRTGDGHSAPARADAPAPMRTARDQAHAVEAMRTGASRRRIDPRLLGAAAAVIAILILASLVYFLAPSRIGVSTSPPPPGPVPAPAPMPAPSPAAAPAPAPSPDAGTAQVPGALQPGGRSTTPSSDPAPATTPSAAPGSSAHSEPPPVVDDLDAPSAPPRTEPRPSQPALPGPSAPDSPPTRPPAPDDATAPASVAARIVDEERAAQEAMKAIVARTRTLQAALHGPKPEQPWNEPFDKWSSAHCEAVIEAMESFDSAINLLPVVFNSSRVATLAVPRGGVLPWPDCDSLVADLPLLAGALASLPLMGGEEFRNAITTRDRAAEALHRSKCPGERVARLRSAYQALTVNLRPLVGSLPRMDGGGTLSGTTTRLRLALDRMRERCAPSLDPALLAELDRLRQSGDSR